VPLLPEGHGNEEEGGRGSYRP